MILSKVVANSHPLAKRKKNRKQGITPLISWLVCLEGAFPVLAASQVLVPRQDLINVCDYRVPRGYSWYLFVFRGEELVLESLFHPFLKVAQTRDIPSAISFGHVICMFLFRYCGAAVSLMDTFSACSFSSYARILCSKVIHQANRQFSEKYNINICTFGYTTHHHHCHRDKVMLILVAS